MAGRFLVLEGPDGAGKTTLAASLAECSYETAITGLAKPGPPATAERPRPLVFAPRRQVSGTSAQSARLMEHLATMLWHSGDPPDLPDAFWVGLQAAWFIAHGETVVTPLLDAGHDVITDGWIYKFCSKLLLQGYAQPDLDVTFSRVRVPDAVILLSADPAALYDRRRHFRPAELGMHAGYKELNRATFIDYQRAGLEHLHGYAATDSWQVAALDPAADPATSARHLAAMIADLRAPAGPVITAPAEAAR